MEVVYDHQITPTRKLTANTEDSVDFLDTAKTFIQICNEVWMIKFNFNICYRNFNFHFSPRNEFKAEEFVYKAKKYVW